MKKNPLTQGKKRKADQFVLGNRLEEARALYASVCKTDPVDVEAWIKLSVTQRRLGSYGDAEASARRALELQPGQALAQHALGSALQCQGKLEQALTAYRRAIELMPAFPDAHYLLGNALMQKGRWQDAEKSLRRALELRPPFFEALSDLGAVLVMTGQVAAAAPLLERALALRPDSPEVLANLANLLEMDERVDEALALYRRALQAQPDAPDVLGKCAELLEKAGRIEEAHETLARGLARDPSHPLLNLVAARLERREERHADAVKRLERILAGPMAESTRGEAQLLLGQLYDRLGQTEKVLANLVEGKRRTAAAADPEGSGRRRFLAKIEHYRTLARSFGQRSLPAPGVSGSSPIFLIGFPRSGTTLLEQILDSHPALRTMEEKPTAAALEQEFVRLAGEGADALDRLDETQLAQLREAYWREAARHVALPAGTQVVDKLPLNTVRVPLLWRVFPDARFILAIRHPCDVTLSCLMQNFGANDAMAGFTSLQSVAEIYAQVMDAWLEFAERLPLRWHLIRYEDLTASFEPEARRLLEFLGVGWDEAVLDHTRRAQERSIINTPSYHQVTQPIYQHARYRWKRYEQDFAAVMPILQPYIDHFGYAE